VVTLSDDPQQRERELERLRRLVSDEDFTVRLAALKALHNTRELDNVPVFIFALGDPDPRVVRQARDSLRLLSRKINGFGLSDEPTDGAKLEAMERWKQWYLSIRPDAQFLN
jgi:HEAT repeat protein